MHTVHINDIHFTVNNKSCTISATISGVPTDSIPDTFAEAFGDTVYPYCYYVRAEIDSGETDYDFSVCDGEWTFSPPAIPGYHSRDTVLTIYESDSLIEINFPYEPGDAVEESSKPIRWSLEAYPNPFNSTVSIEYSVAEAGEVSVEIYNILGEYVGTISDGYRAQGIYSARWDGNNAEGQTCPSGVYFCKMECKNTSLLRKLLILR